MTNFARLSRLLVVLAAIVLASAACRYDYLFIAYEIECPLDEDGHPRRCYPRNTWNLVQCTTYESSPFEILAGTYSLELDMDIPAPPDPGARSAGFPRRLQIEVAGFDADGDSAFRLRPKPWKVAGATGRVEEEITVGEDLTVPAGGKLCLSSKTKGNAELTHGWLMGILLEKVVG